MKNKLLAKAFIYLYLLFSIAAIAHATSLQNGESFQEKLRHPNGSA